jgi:hypothetical protein
LRASIAGNIAGLIVIPQFEQIMGRQSVLFSFGARRILLLPLTAFAIFGSLTKFFISVSSGSC